LKFTRVELSGLDPKLAEHYPEVKDFLVNLSELRSSSEIYSEFFYKVSQICNNINALSIIFEKSISNGLANLVSSQKNLKYLKLVQTSDILNWSEIMPALTKHHVTITKLHLHSSSVNVPLFIMIIDSKIYKKLFYHFHLKEHFIILINYKVLLPFHD
jgi:hypothetical protein